MTPMPKRKVRRAVKHEPPRTYEPRAKLTDLEVAKLMVATECALATVHRWKKGEPVKPSTHGQLSRAAAKLGIEVRA